MATPNLALIPTGYKAGKVYSVLPETGVGDFAFTRASAATRINSNGLLEVPKYSIGGELVTNGDFATDSDWNKSGDWVISGGVATGSSSNINQNCNLVNGKTYIVTYTVTAITGTSVRVGGSVNYIEVPRTAVGTYSTILNYTTGIGTNGVLYWTAAGLVSIDNVSVIEYAINDVPRLQYPLIDGVVNGCPSLLLEPQATNLITYPISFGNSYWTKSGATIQGDPSTAGSELIENGDFATDSDWNKGTGWSISGGKANALNLSSVSMNQDVGIIGGKTYKVTYTISEYVSGSLIPIAGGSSLGVSRISNGTFTDYINAAANSNGSLYLQGNGAFTGSVDNVSVKEVQGYSSPSVDFPTSAFKLVEDTSTALHYCIKTISVTSGTSYTYSFIAKYSGRHLQLSSSTAFPSAHINYDLQNGTLAIGSGGTVSGTIEALPDGYYRCTYTDTANATSPVGLIIPLLSNSTTAPKNPSYTGDGTSGIYIFMAQLETGSYATSPTLTSLSAEGTTTTRVAEVCNGAGDASTFNDSEGVLMAEVKSIADTGVSASFYLGDGTLSNRLQILLRSTGIISSFYQNTSLSTIMDSTILNYDSLHKVAVVYNSTALQIWVDGIKQNETLGNHSFTPSTLNVLSMNVNGSEIIYGKTKQIQYFNTVLTSAELETLTSWTSFISMANALNYNII